MSVKIEDLKVGMKVLVRSDLITDRYYAGSKFISEMESLLGKVVTIEKIIGIRCFSIKEKGCFWTPEMIEKIVEDNMKKIEEYENGTLFSIKNSQRQGYEWFIKIDKRLYSLVDMTWLSETFCPLTISQTLKIATINYIGDVFNCYKRNGDIETLDGFKIIWQRKSEEQQKLETIITNLETELNKAKKQLEEIKQ